jgi:hypothetical protein
MNIEHLTKLTTNPYYTEAWPGISDFLRLLSLNIPSKCLDVNDWGSSSMPCVYVHNKHKRFAMRRYRRFSGLDAMNAIRFYNMEKPINYIK